MCIRLDVRNVHLLGICGTAMAALAAMLKERGFQVTGSDQGVYPPMSEFLADRGIPVREGFGPQNLGEDVDLVVIGNALSRGNPEVEAVLDRGIPYRSLPEVLREWFIQGKRSLVVTGTHGKTTCASLLAWILYWAGRDPSFLIGGIPQNFSSGFRLGEGDEMVLEGDEYDTAFFDKRPKFLHYLPRIVTLGALEYDHADIYRDMEAFLQAFRWFMRVIPKSGQLIIHRADPHVRQLASEAPCPVMTCALEDGEADWTAQGILVTEGRVQFRVRHDGRELGECAWALPGRHNIINALLAVAAAHAAGIDPHISMDAVRTFKGVRRRLEYLGEPGGVLLYDDFAHHPTAIRSSLEALREFYPERRIWAVMEPRSNTMCRSIFQKVLPEAFAPADRVLIGAVHRAGRIPQEERLDPQVVVDEIRRKGKEAWYLPRVSEIVEILKDRVGPGDVVCIMSNGNFGGIQDLLKAEFLNLR